MYMPTAMSSMTLSAVTDLAVHVASQRGLHGSILSFCWTGSNFHPSQIGSVIIILHAPADRDVQTVDEILEYAMRPGMLPTLRDGSHVSCQILNTAFLFYVTFVGVFASYMIFKVAPKYGTKNPMVYLSICSLVGSVSVMAIKVSVSV